jgi:hypothetical protein
MNTFLQKAMLDQNKSLYFILQLNESRILTFPYRQWSVKTCFYSPGHSGAAKLTFMALWQQQTDGYLSA